MSHVPAPESTESDGMPESGPVSDRDAQDAREARYAEAIHRHTCGDGETCCWEEDITPCADVDLSGFVRGFLPVADAELAPLVARVAELEAEVLVLRGGKSAEASMAAIREVLAVTARAERAEAALARVEALHRPWYEVDGVRHDHLVPVYGTDKVPDGHVCRIGTEWDSCVPEPEDPESSEHWVLACYECRCATEEGEPGYYFWPCATARALAAAGPAVSDAPRQADATLRAKLLDLHVECRMGMCGEPSGFCHQCDNDWPCDTVEYVRLFSAAPAVSDGEGATSEACQCRSWDGVHLHDCPALARGGARAEACHRVHSRASVSGRRFGFSAAGEWEPCPASPVVAPSATDEGGA